MLTRTVIGVGYIDLEVVASGPVGPDYMNYWACAR